MVYVLQCTIVIQITKKLFDGIDHGYTIHKPVKKMEVLGFRASNEIKVLRIIILIAVND